MLSLGGAIRLPLPHVPQEQPSPLGIVPLFSNGELVEYADRQCLRRWPSSAVQLDRDHLDERREGEHDSPLRLARGIWNLHSECGWFGGRPRSELSLNHEGPGIPASARRESGG